MQHELAPNGNMIQVHLVSLVQKSNERCTVFGFVGIEHPMLNYLRPQEGQVLVGVCRGSKIG